VWALEQPVDFAKRGFAVAGFVTQVAEQTCQAQCRRAVEHGGPAAGISNDRDGLDEASCSRGRGIFAALGDGAKRDIVVSADFVADDGSARFEPVDFERGSTGGNEEFTDRGFEAGNVAVQSEPCDQRAREADQIGEQFTRPAHAEASECRDGGGFGRARKRFTIGRAQPWSPK
jgi:hypothetical protein